MLTLIIANWLPLAIALIIGIITGWWIWAEQRGQRVVLDIDTSQRSGLATHKTAPANFWVEDNAAGTAAATGADAAAEPMAAASAMASIAPTPAPVAPAAAPTTAETTAQAFVSPPGGFATGAAASDDLTLIKGLGPKLAGLLNSLGVTRFADIAGWDDAKLDWIDTKLGSFAGRARRDRWVEQARLLAHGDIAAFESQYGKLGSENK